MHDIEKKNRPRPPSAGGGKRRVQVMVALRQQDVDAINRTALEDVMRQGFLTTDRNGQSFRVMTVDAAHAWGFIAE